MDWQDIVTKDPYLAGSIAAHSFEWWDETTAEQEAERVGLVGVQQSRFIQGWNAELAEQAQERKEHLIQAYDEMAAGYEKGDPAV